MSVKAQLTGTVVSDKMDKTVRRSPSSGSPPRRLRQGSSAGRRSSVAHNEDNEAKLGDTVAIAESRPLSRRKRWIVTSVVAKAPQV
jgi:small subunit ribosomal protein S17